MLPIRLFLCAIVVADVARSAEPSEAPPAATAVWPAAGAPLVSPQLPDLKRRRRMRVYLDAGHGARSNPGNSSVTCEEEQAFTFRLATALAKQLEATKRFRVKVSRGEGELVSYPQRLEDALAFEAEAIVSLHSDSRGMPGWWSPGDGRWCLRSEGEPGFGILFSSEGRRRLVDRRRTLASAIARRMGEAGFLPYDGASWWSRYDPDEERGVFVDGRDHGRRLFLLRKPKIPSIILETHHALDFEEAARWAEPRTIETFAAALAAGLADALRPSAKLVAESP
jgi:N-acetylmuramoyl-L-alanine amidase